MSEMVISVIRTQFRLLSAYIPFFKIFTLKSLCHIFILGFYCKHTHILCFQKKEEKEKFKQCIANKGKAHRSKTCILVSRISYLRYCVNEGEVVDCAAEAPKDDVVA